MNWKLVFLLSLFGLAMGIATVFVISPRIEPILWLAIFLLCAYVIARQCASRPFLHGVFLGLVNSVWITAAHILFFQRYLAGHLREAAMSASASHPRVLMGIVGPIIGLISGAIIGLFAVIARRLLARPRSPASGSA